MPSHLNRPSPIHPETRPALIPPAVRYPVLAYGEVVGGGGSVAVGALGHGIAALNGT